MNHDDENRLRRRRFMRALAGCGAVALAGPRFSAASPQAIRMPIPSSGELLPVIGMGSWLTFDVGDNIRARAVRTQVLQTFFDHGGALIDSSPMYGSSQEVIGHALAQVPNKSALFAATKVWILGKGFGIRQMEDAGRLWGVPRFDLMQVHNLLDWETHLETLKGLEGRGTPALHRCDHLARPASRRHGAGDAAPSRSISCNSPTTSSTARRSGACCRSQPSAASR
jgi:hypothetical protein